MFTCARLTAIGSVLFLLILAGCVSQADYDLLKTHNNELNAQLTQARADADTTRKSDQAEMTANKKQIEELTADVEKYKSAGKETLAAIDQLKAKLDKDEADLTNARVYKGENEDKIKQLQQNAATAQASLEEAKKTATANQAELAALQGKLSELQNVKDELEKQVAGLKAGPAAPTTRP